MSTVPNPDPADAITIPVDAAFTLEVPQAFVDRLAAAIVRGLVARAAHDEIDRNGPYIPDLPRGVKPPVVDYGDES